MVTVRSKTLFYVTTSGKSRANVAKVISGGFCYSIASWAAMKHSASIESAVKPRYQPRVMKWCDKWRFYSAELPLWSTIVCPSCVPFHICITNNMKHCDQVSFYVLFSFSRTVETCTQSYRSIQVDHTLAGGAVDVGNASIDGIDSLSHRQLSILEVFEMRLREVGQCLHEHPVGNVHRSFDQFLLSVFLDGFEGTWV